LEEGEEEEWNMRMRSGECRESEAEGGARKERKERKKKRLILWVRISAFATLAFHLRKNQLKNCTNR